MLSTLWIIITFPEINLCNLFWFPLFYLTNEEIQHQMEQEEKFKNILYFILNRSWFLCSQGEADGISIFFCHIFDILFSMSKCKSMFYLQWSNAQSISRLQESKKFSCAISIEAGNMVKPQIIRQSYLLFYFW